MRGHGVDPEFIASLDNAGYKNLSAEQLVRLRDHGVDGDYIASLREAGYERLSLQERFAGPATTA